MASNRLELGQQYTERLDAGETQQQLLDEFNSLYRKDKKPRTRGFISRLIRDYRQHIGQSKIIHIPRAEFVSRPENQDTDSGTWASELQYLLNSNRYVRVMHMNDLHLPYHDEGAVKLFFELARRFKPDVVVVGSDAFDYPTISRYDSDPDIKVEDWLLRTEQYWIPIINSLRNIVPHALLPFIFGNHDRRGLNAIKQSTYPVVGMREYKRIITHGGVFWLGKTEVVKIGALTVAHGTRFNKYAAAYTSGDFNFQPVNVGHTHRPQQMLSCVVNGMLCQAVPAYQDNGYPSDWQHGTSLITIDTESNTVLQQPHLFTHGIHGLWTAYGDEIIHAGVQSGERGLAA